MARKGFSAVGLTEILTTAGVPKGSFYHYFGSKDAFGDALLEQYFKDYLAEIDATFQGADTSIAKGLVRYFESWRMNQLGLDCQGKCLVVKLGAEVADLSEAMRLTLKKGTAGIVARLADAIERGTAEGSLERGRRAGPGCPTMTGMGNRAPSENAVRRSATRRSSSA